MREVALKSVISIIRNGLNTTQYDEPIEPDMLPISRIETIWNGTLDLTRIKYASVTNTQKEKYLLAEGDILFSHINSPAHIGKTALVHPNQELLHGVNLLLLRPKHDLVNSRYLNYYLKSNPVRKYFRVRCKKAVNQASLNQGDITQIRIPLPPLTEQERIAALLDKADRLRRLRCHALQLGDSYLQSVFLEMFGDPGKNPKGWQDGKIDDVVTFSQYGTSTKSNDDQHGYPVLGMGSITYAGEIDLSSLSYVTLDENEFDKLRLEHGDIIFNRTNSTELVGKTAYWDLEMDAVIASYLVKLKLRKDVLPEYFTALLNSHYYKTLFQLRCRKAVGQSNISPTYLKEFPVLVPPVPLQEKFVQVVQRYERLRSQQREALRQAKHLFESLLSQAFEEDLTGFENLSGLVGRSRG